MAYLGKGKDIFPGYYHYYFTCSNFLAFTQAIKNIKSPENGKPQSFLIKSGSMNHVGFVK